jgi:hypothetical protein
MKRVLLIFLSLVLALVGGSAACAEDGFYVIGGGGKSALLPKTGQTTSYGTGDDGDLEKGVAWPTPRFTNNNNGTITDNLTKLIWMKDAQAFGLRTWAQALSDANGLQAGYGGLTDGSKAGDWRLPNLRELQSLISYAFNSPALPNTLGTGKWTEGNPFLHVIPDYYWSSSTFRRYTPDAWVLNFDDGNAEGYDKSYTSYVWCVRGGP